MCHVTVIIALALTVQANAKKLATDHIAEPQDFLDEWVDKLVDQLFDDLFDQVLKIGPIQHTDLDETMLWKPSHLAITTRTGHVIPYNRPGIPYGYPYIPSHYSPKSQRISAVQTNAQVVLEERNHLGERRGLDALPNYYPEVEELSAQDFLQITADPAHEPLVVDWEAKWCRKCKWLKPKLAKLKARFPELRFIALDVNACPMEVVKGVGVKKMPTIQLWRHGRSISEVIGGEDGVKVAETVAQEVQKMLNQKELATATAATTTEAAVTPSEVAAPAEAAPSEAAEARAAAVVSTKELSTSSSSSISSSGSLEELSTEEFLQITADPMHQPLVVDWEAKWCRKCKWFKPKLAKLKALFPKLRFIALDVNKSPMTVVQSAGIKKMPTIQFWKEGRSVSEVIGGEDGLKAAREVQKMIENVVGEHSDA